MANPELLQTLDYILNKSDAASIEVIAEAVVRRRRSMSMFSVMGEMPDPQRMAENLSAKINEGIGAGMDGMKKTVRDMMIRIVKQNAPELNANQIDELCEAWLPQDGGKTEKLPTEVLLSMIEQFLSFSNGTMKKSIDEDLRKEMGSWPQRYWKAFPPVVRQLITDYLKDKITEKDFKTKIVYAIGKK